MSANTKDGEYSSSLAAKNRLVVIKVGTSTLMKSNPYNGDQTVNLANMGGLVDMVANLHQSGQKVVIVTSAAVGFGCLKMKMKERPKTLALKQAVAAAGQSQLIRMYEDLFGVYDVPVAQVLLSRFDFSSKDRFANVQNTLRELLALGAIPIINENDCVSIEELKFGDNDTLSALVAVGLSASKLFLLTDVDCLYTANPRTNPAAQPVLDVSAHQLATLGGAESSGGQWGTGGMYTKIVAARTACCAGIETLLVHGGHPERVAEYLQAVGAAPALLAQQQQDSSTTPASPTTRPLCTVFHVSEGMPSSSVFVPSGSTMTPHRRWLLALPVRGVLTVDAGATAAIASKHSLMAAGVLEIMGSFLRDECVSLVSKESGAEVARALMNLDSKEIAKIKGLKSNEYESALGYIAAPEISYRSNIVLIAAPTAAL